MLGRVTGSLVSGELRRGRARGPSASHVSGPSARAFLAAADPVLLVHDDRPRVGELAGATALFFDTPGVYATITLAGGGGYAVAAVLERRRLTTAPR